MKSVNIVEFFDKSDKWLVPKNADGVSHGTVKSMCLNLFQISTGNLANKNTLNIRQDAGNGNLTLVTSDDADSVGPSSTAGKMGLD